VKALHGLGLSHYGLGDLPKSKDALERALTAAGGSQDRAVVLNLSLVHLKQNNSARAIKLLRDYLTRPAKDLDEPMYDGLAIALAAADEQAKKNSAYTQAVTTFKSYTGRLEAKRPGMKLWGVEWMSSDELSQKLSGSEQAQKKADRLSQQLVTLNRRLDDAQKDLAKKEDLRKRGAIGQWEVRESENEMKRVQRERDDVQTEHDAAAAEIEKPSFPADWELVSIDAITPPPVGSGEGSTARGDGESGGKSGGMSRFDDNNNSSSNNNSGGGMRFKDDPRKAATPPPTDRTRSGQRQGNKDRNPQNTPPRNEDTKKQQHAKMEYAAAFPVAPDLLVTAAYPLEEMVDIQVQAHDGTPIKATVVRVDAKTGLALLRISGPKMAYLDLAGSFAGGAVNCAGFPTENYFEPTAELIKGTATRGGDNWKVKLDKHPRIPGSPLLGEDGKVVGVCTATEHEDLDNVQLPAATLDQLRRFIGTDLPKTAGDKPDVLSVMLQVAVTH
jgi:hypothetical protein